MSVYPDDTRFALREGGMVLVTATEAVLRHPTRREKLTGLTDVQLRALRRLPQGPATISELARSTDDLEVAELIERLTDGGWLSVTVRVGYRDLYTLHPSGRPATRPSGVPWAATLSTYATLRRDSVSFLLEHPKAWCELRIHDPRLLALLDGPGAADSSVPIAIKTQFTEDLLWGGFFVGDPDTEDY
ncbi:hypothetical protein [Nocardia goodfellowii]|uniref:Uncharacterized protein n=1 Tax=Nocardia goodfellowii TaxID=882446 RepID=A0ABS4Q8H4_9NOCA|nr:hypothetical protein [Nocardia goodfellowii]MBP2187445.1 hypothetical protein [Nocardia goodfellowii]